MTGRHLPGTQRLVVVGFLMGAAAASSLALMVSKIVTFEQLGGMRHDNPSFSFQRRFDDREISSAARACCG
ncbi:hypothetical protein [Burkholderia cepacia]|uniref:hypothetical protein n=1 Tax=Burkholderia cepacia TaxID=292 RepID=UPI001592ADE8|nr:hypothetical protein [Burkholderia cepacia]